MAPATAPHHRSHPAPRGQLVLIVATIAAVLLAAVGIAVLVHGGGQWDPESRDRASRLPRRAR